MGSKSSEITVRPPTVFRHAGQLHAGSVSRDPRSSTFDASRVVIDLRDCEFVLPAAALWCVIYLILAKRHNASCVLLVPNEMGVAAYLKALGLFDILKANTIDVDARGIRKADSTKTILPITPFSSAADATRITNEAHEQLTAANLAATNLGPIVSELFSELALNAAQHSESGIGAFGCINLFNIKSGSRFGCVVADGGIGVRASLWKNPALKSRANYDWDALELAVRERVSGTGDPHRGIGLYGVSEDIRKPGRNLLLHSGLGALEISEELESEARRTSLFPGTLAYLSIPA